MRKEKKNILKKNSANQSNYKNLKLKKKRLTF